MSDYSEEASTDAGDSSSISNDDLIAAVSESMGESGTETPQAADGEPTPARAVADADPREVIRARMDKARAAKASKAEERRHRDESERLRQYDQAQAAQKPAFDLEGFKKRLHSNPLTVLQELGIDLDTFTTAALNENSPQSKATDELRALREKMEAFENQRKEVEQRESESARQQQRHRAEQDFCSIIVPEEYPSLHEFFSDDVPALLIEARQVARDFVAKGGDADNIGDEDIAWYLEQKYSKKLNRLKGKAAAQRVAQPAAGSSKPRSPSQASASDTRMGGQKDFYDLSPSEQDALLNEVVRLEMQKSAS